MAARSESEILAKSPIKAKLGDKDYSIPVLTVLAARSWRTKLDAAMAGLTGSFQVLETAEAPAVSRGLTFALIQFPEKVVDLVFDYAGELLPKEEILASATEEQLASAFSSIMQVAYPFLNQLAMVTQVMRSSATPPALGKSTN